MMTVLLLNLSPTTAMNVTLSARGMPEAAGPRMEWHLTGANGTGSVEMALNRALLRAEKNGTGWTLPPLASKAVASSAGVVMMAPSSIAFVQLNLTRGAAVCQ